MASQNHHKVVVLGSGPAGLTAAIYASRAELKPLVIEGGGNDDPTDVAGGQLMLTTDVDNYPGFPKGILGPELMEGMRKQAERFGTQFITGSVSSVALGTRPFVLKTSVGDITTEALIIATGARAKWLGIDEEVEFRTRIGGVSACATCDGFFYKNKHVLVVGGGDTAMEEATFLTKFASKVTIVHRRDALRASKIMQEKARKNPKIEWLLDSTIEKYLGKEAGKFLGARVKNLKSGETKDVECGGVFMGIGHEPNTAVFGGQLETDPSGYLITKPGSTATSIPGVFAAGDVADHQYRQAVTAAGTGCMAAIDAERYLSQ
jgi:thioredoxin reductase (NADPH)